MPAQVQLVITVYRDQVDSTDTTILDTTMVTLVITEATCMAIHMSIKQGMYMCVCVCVCFVRACVHACLSVSTVQRSHKRIQLYLSLTLNSSVPLSIADWRDNLGTEGIITSY